MSWSPATDLEEHHLTEMKHLGEHPLPLGFVKQLLKKMGKRQIPSAFPIQSVKKVSLFSTLKIHVDALHTATHKQKKKPTRTYYMAQKSV